MITSRTIVLTVAALTAALTLSSCAVGGPAPGAGGSSSDSSAGSSTGSSATAAFNDADVLFAQLMIPHHKQAVEMSEDLLAKTGVDARVTDIATSIKAAQQPEIDQMTGWLTQWGAPEESSGGMAGMGGMGNGMMSDDDMMALRSSSAADAGALFLSQMIMHHEGAIVMAQAELTDGESADAQALARSIVETQTAQITEMKDLLAAL